MLSCYNFKIASTCIKKTQLLSFNFPRGELHVKETIQLFLICPLWLPWLSPTTPCKILLISIFLLSNCIAKHKPRKLRDEISIMRFKT